ncbi:17849_t:CDS:2, partial [Racocetra persica]
MARFNFKLLALLLVILATVISAAEIDVDVGSNGELAFNPSDVSVKVGDTVILSDTPNGCTETTTIPNLIILNQTNTVGASGTLTITQDLPSTFGFYCDVPSHCDEGNMYGKITVG